MTTITKELLAEIKAKAEKAVQHRSAFGDPYWSVEIAPHTFTPYRLDLDPPTTIAFVEALEEAQRERDAAVQYGVRELMPEGDALRAENEKLREALEFYADKSAWNQPPVKTIASELFGPAYQNQASKMQEDRGKIARTALKETTHAKAHQDTD